MVYRETCLLSCYLPQKHEYRVLCQRLSVTVEQDRSRYLLPVDLFVVFKSNKTKVICKVTVDLYSNDIENHHKGKQKYITTMFCRRQFLCRFGFAS